MKEVSADILNAAAGEKSRAAVWADLVKARLTALVLLTTLVGFYLGWRGAMNFALMFNTLAATALVAAGAAALNQLLERDYDARMRRTQSRPLPSGRMQPTTVMIFGGVSSVAGLVYLALAVNLLTCVLGAITLVSYLFLYTPLKRVTWLNTVIGAVPGALPPLMGWTVRAASGAVRGGPCSPFYFSGSCPISLPLPGCIGRTMPRRDSKCCRGWIRTAGARGSRP